MECANNAGTKSSEKKMKGDQDAMRTVECLRGRLLAERSASRAAKENVDLLAKKLKELEDRLKIEVKAREKAEKKLNLLKKKLESLGMTVVTEIENHDRNLQKTDEDDLDDDSTAALVPTLQACQQIHQMAQKESR
ncbi:hypothetical protein Dimus_007246 [Dionaea muscipula]